MGTTCKVLLVLLLAETVIRTHGADSGNVPVIGPFVPGPAQDALDSIDKLYSKIDGVTNVLKLAAEQIGNLESLLSLMTKAVRELDYTTFVSLYNENREQNLHCDQINDHLDQIMMALNDIESNLTAAKSANSQNMHGIQSVDTAVTAAKVTDNTQDGQITALHTAIQDLKSKLFTVIANEFASFSNKVELVSQFLSGVSEFEKSRMCENGEVTLDRDDRRAEVLFQTRFAKAPQVHWSITGFNFDLDTRPPAPPSYVYGYYRPYVEPNAIGVITNAISSKTGVTFEAFDLSFGDTQLQSVTVAFQACSIGPGTEISDAHRNITVVTQPTVPASETTTTTSTTPTPDY